MPLDEQELSYLWDMQDAAKEINSFMRGVKFAKFEKTKVLRYAAERQLLVIGEAANHISPSFVINTLKSPGQNLLECVMLLRMNMAKH